MLVQTSFQRLSGAAQPSDHRTVAGGSPKPIYDYSLPLQEKTRIIAREIYGAGDGYFESEARKALARFAEAGSMMRMPGLGKTPQAFFMDVDDSGVISGLR